ncbi:DUF1552 domain-containing protein [Humisphaera borealis]|uniref:DUF1552 domain-containing protein n=1 Tax=Humisphaera borealis TaxID=2807512 RepID=A0A7M2X2V3_9BACT|nr:DUF1552 domain-containing protein [Humisphaera borealis]QOV91949.1 DUF1552 domain-containing protein [Humisphaera borealis]
MTHRNTSRRDILKGFGLGVGASLLSPMLNQIMAASAGKPAPRRVVFVTQSNGMNPDHVRPVGVAKTYRDRHPTNDRLIETSIVDKQLHEAIEPLTPFRDRMTLLQGLSGRIGISDHSANYGALGACPGNKGPLWQTIDHAVAAAIPGVVPHVAIGVGANPGVLMNYRLSVSGPGQACPIVCSPELAFKSLFGAVADGADAKAFDQKSNLLDFMAGDVKRAQATLVGDERQKLDGYLAAFESLHKRQREIADMRGKLKEHAPALGAERLRPSASSLILESQFEIGAAALIAGLTNVLLLTSGGGGQGFGEFPELGVPELHGIGHGSAQNGRSAAQCFVDLRRFHTGLIAGLAKKLDAIREGDGTMLDNTVIVYLSDSGEQHHPSLYEWPVVLIGGLGGKLRTAGRFLELPGYGQKEHRTLANLYCTLLHAVGKPVDKFGVPDAMLRETDQTGPIATLLA